MITAVDTNMLLDVLIPDVRFADTSRRLLDEAQREGGLVIGEVVYAALGAHFGGRRELDAFLADTRIRVQSAGPEALMLAAEACRACARRRDRAIQCPRCGERQVIGCPACSEQLAPRQHILSDFLVGGHALAHADCLLTRDRGFHAAFFPSLHLTAG